MCRARDRVWGVLIAWVVQVIILVAGLSVCFGPESSTVEGIPPDLPLRESQSYCR
jgi:hypothetical protein